MLIILLYRLFDEISLLRNQGARTRAGFKGDLLLRDCGLRACGMIRYITVDDQGESCGWSSMIEAECLHEWLVSLLRPFE